VIKPDIADLIKDIAIYLRKSRGKDGMETDEVLEKHRIELIDFAKKNNFRYSIYQEVKSGDDIAERPEMIRLLQDVEEGLWDAVLCIDIDRLGRGNEENSGKIKRIFHTSETLIMTPTKIYNLENEDDETYFEFQTFLARQEYKIIKKRLQRGKKQGARNGKWTSGGSPPLPYDYDKTNKILIVNKDKLIIYNMIKKLFLEDLLTLEQVAYKLNELTIPTPRNSSTGWKGRVIKGILINEIPLGRIVSNKSKGKYKNGKKTTFYTRDKWVIVENCHEAVKTFEEHEQITKRLEIISKPRKHSYKYPLSTLVQCELCGRILQIHHHYLYNNNVVFCPGYSPTGVRCINKGIKEDELIKKLFEHIEEYLNQNNLDDDLLDKEIEYLKNQLIPLDEKYKKNERSLNIIYQMREDGEYTAEQFLTRKEKRIQEMDSIKEQIKIIEDEIKNLDSKDIKTISDNYYLLKEKWEYMTSEGRNQMLSQLISRIYYYRNNDGKKEVIIKVKFR
jgi:DNA invertase Pin-like site-specific DNA recombinase